MTGNDTTAQSSNNQVLPHAEGDPDLAPKSPADELLELFRLIVLRRDLKVEPRRFLVEGLWPEYAIGFFGGQPKCGKTWLALDFGIAVATGASFLGRSISKPGVVHYFLGEDDFADTHQRIGMLLKGRGLTWEDLGGRFLLTELTPNLEDPGVRNKLTMLLEAHSPDLVVFDTLARFLDESDENSSKDLRPIANWLRVYASRLYKASVLVTHHLDKEGRGLRGTGDLRALSEVTVLFRKLSKSLSTLSVEMRKGRAPEPFKVEFREVSEDEFRIETELTREQRAAQLLRDAGERGLSGEEVRMALRIRTKDVPSLLAAIGASRAGPRTRWLLSGRDFPLGKTDQKRGIPASTVSGENSPASESQARELAISRDKKASGKPAPNLFPQRGGLEDPAGEEEDSSERDSEGSAC